MYQEISDRVTSELESHDEFEPATVGPPIGTFERLTVSEVRLSRSGSCVEFTFSGDFEVSMSASLVRSAADGFGLVELQGDVYATGRFEFVGLWDPSEDPDDLGEMAPWMTSWEAETSVVRT